MDKKKYFKTYDDNTFRIDGTKNAYEVKIYDKKNNNWKDADIKGKTLKECKEITKYVYGASPEGDLNITIDYGDYKPITDEQESIY